MQVKPLSGVVPGATPGTTPFGQSQRMELIAELMNKPSKSGSALTRTEPLLTLLNDTETLSRFIRYSGLSEEMSAALLLDIAKSATPGMHLSARSMAEVSEILTRMKPTTAGIKVSYGAIAGFGELGCKPARSNINASEINAGSPDGMGPFMPFSPTQTDFKNTIDDLRERGPSSEDHGQNVPPGWFTPIDPGYEKIQGISGMAYIVLTCLTGILAFGIFAVIH